MVPYRPRRIVCDFKILGLSQLGSVLGSVEGGLGMMELDPRDGAAATDVIRPAKAGGALQNVVSGDAKSLAITPLKNCSTLAARRAS